MRETGRKKKKGGGGCCWAVEAERGTQRESRWGRWWRRRGEVEEVGWRARRVREDIRQCVWAPADPSVTYFILHQHAEPGRRGGWWIIEKRERWMRSRLPSSSSPLSHLHGPLFSLFPAPLHFFFFCSWTQGQKKIFINNWRDFLGRAGGCALLTWGGARKVSSSEARLMTEKLVEEDTSFLGGEGTLSVILIS